MVEPYDQQFTSGAENQRRIAGADLVGEPAATEGGRAGKRGRGRLKEARRRERRRRRGGRARAGAAPGRRESTD